MGTSNPPAIPPTPFTKGDGHALKKGERTDITNRTMSETKDSVKIRHLMEQAGRLPKDDSIVVLKALLATVAEEDGDWMQTLRMAIEEAEERQETPEIHSSYKISSRQVTAFVKLFRIIYDLHIFETADGRIASNSENFINDLALFFNTEIKHTRNLLSSAKRTGNFMDVFDRLHELAQAYYEKGDELNAGKRAEAREWQQRIDFGNY
jgi:hypothetical protein